MKQKEANQFFIDIMDILKLENNCHVFLIDKKNRLLAANQTQIQVIQQVTGIKAADKIIGIPIKDLFLKKQAFELIKKENNMVIEGKQAMLFYNLWRIDNYKKISLLTMKTPLYDSKKKIIGIFGISVYLSESSFENYNQINLSDREIQCLDYLLRGKVTKEIAGLTKLSARTVEGYLKNIKRKLNVNSKSALINKALSLGIEKINKLAGIISEGYKSGIFMSKE